LTEDPRLCLLLVGDDPFGDHRKAAEAVARDLKLGDRVKFLGIRRDVPRILAASDVFVMSSLWEGLGLVFLEAMAAGLPVVATRVSAIPEVVPHGRAGLLVPANDPTAMARAFLQLASRPDRGRQMGLDGRSWVRERFGVDRMIDETLLVYEGVASRA
jgi:glycosyltransferase involved in cell wall biosynthesis